MSFPREIAAIDQLFLSDLFSYEKEILYLTRIFDVNV